MQKKKKKNYSKLIDFLHTQKIFYGYINLNSDFLNEINR